MNKARRNAIQVLLTQLEEIVEAIEDVRQKEECVYDNTPENLQNSQRYQDMEENLCELEDAITGISDSCSLLQSVLDR